MNASVQDRWGRKEKAARGLCGRYHCQQKAEPGMSLCQHHIEAHARQVAWLEAHPLTKPQPVIETHIYVCSKCLDETDDPSHLCKCNPD